MRISDWSSDVCSSDLAIGSICSFDTGYLQCSVDAANGGLSYTLGTYLLLRKPRFFSHATSVFIHIDRALTRSFHRHTVFRNTTPIRKTRCAVCQRQWKHEIFFRVRRRDTDNWTTYDQTPQHSPSAP